MVILLTLQEAFEAHTDYTFSGFVLVNHVSRPELRFIKLDNGQTTIQVRIEGEYNAAIQVGCHMQVTGSVIKSRIDSIKYELQVTDLDSIIIT